MLRYMLKPGMSNSVLGYDSVAIAVTCRLWVMLEEMWLQRLPAMSVVVVLYLSTLREPPVRDSHHQTRLEHKRHTTLAHLSGLKLGIAGSFVGRGVRSMCRHDVMQGGSRRLKAAALAAVGLCVVLARDQTHKLGHGVAVVPRRSERVFHHEPSRWEDHKVGDGGAWVIRLRRKDSVYRRIHMVEGDASNRIESSEIVFVRVVVAMPIADESIIEQERQARNTMRWTNHATTSNGVCDCFAAKT